MSLPFGGEISDLMLMTNPAEVPGCDEFVADGAALKAANVYWGPENFKLFLQGKREKNVPAVRMWPCDLLKAISTIDIIDQCGGGGGPLILAGQLFSMLALPLEEISDVLPLSGRSIMVLFHDRKDNLAVATIKRVFDPVCWNICAYPVDLRKWPEGQRVLIPQR